LAHLPVNDDAVNDDSFDGDDDDGADDDGDDAATTVSLISLLGSAGAAKIASQTVVARRCLVVLLVAWRCSFSYSFTLPHRFGNCNCNFLQLQVRLHRLLLRLPLFLLLGVSKSANCIRLANLVAAGVKSIALSYLIWVINKFV